MIDKLLVDPNSFEVHLAGEIDELVIETNLKSPAHIDPELNARLNSLKPGETVPVMLWLRTPRGKDVGTRQHLAYTRLAEMFPEAKAAMDEFGNPFSVQDEELLRTIRIEYDRFMSESADNAAVLAVADVLTRNRVSFRALSPMPALALDVDRDLVDLLRSMKQVERIYLATEKVQTALVDARATQGFGGQRRKA